MGLGTENRKQRCFPLYIVQNGRDLKCTWRVINNGLFDRPSGYLVEVFDDTNQQKYLRLLRQYNSQLEGYYDAVEDESD